MDKNLTSRLSQILSNISNLKETLFPDFDLEIGYLTVFSNNTNDYIDLNNLLETIGEKNEASNGYKYELNTPVISDGVTIKEIRVRRPDIHRAELGCCDLIYKNSDYPRLREIALEKGMDIILRKDYEMIELSTFDIPVYAYLVKDL
jgi:hypothetical protein